MDDQDARREAHQREAARPGKIILLGAFAMACGTVAAVKLLQLYVKLAGQPPVGDTPELSLLRAPAVQFHMWMALVMSVLLAASGVGLLKIRPWARPLFFALAIARGALLVADILRGVPNVGVDVLLYAAGVLLLARSHAAEMFREPDR